MPKFLGPELFDFLRELQENNNRDWFQAHKARYETDVKEPLLAMIAAFAEPLRSVSPHLRADPRPVGGSMFRIYKDVRFSKDKSPYKTHAAAQFRHVKGRDVHAPGFYLHLEPGLVFGGAGVKSPDPKSLRKIRDRIVADADGWREATSGHLKRGCHFEGEALQRAPKGFDPDHPLIEDLKRKEYILIQDFSEQAATRADFLDRYVKFCRDAAPFMAFLTGALKLPW